MSCARASLLLLLAYGCAATTPEEHAAQVRALPGTRPLRVGLVVLSQDGKVREALPEPAPAPGGAAPAPRPAPVGELYADTTVLPDSLPEEAVRQALLDLGAFTDVVPLPFDSRGIASREALVQRLQDRLWSTAHEQELDALLVIEGVRDRGLRWADTDESLFSLDTVLWWLVWPLGVLIRDRDYTADVALVADLFSLHDQRATPQAFDATATAGVRSVREWTRAGAPVLGFVLPPVWVPDDRDAVARQVREWSRATLPTELVRRLKTSMPAEAAELRVRARGDVLELSADSSQEITEATLVALPLGALTEPVTPVPVHLESQLVPTAQGARHAAKGSVPVAALRQSARPLLRARVTFASGETASRTWRWSEL